MGCNHFVGRIDIIKSRVFLISVLLGFTGFLILPVQSLSIEVDATSIVTNVIDGDTFDVALGERIRLADVDAPESWESGYSAAKDFLVDLVYGKKTYLDIDDIYEIDPYDRLVCVVYVEHNSTHFMNVNKALIAQGHAKIADYDNEFSPYLWNLYVSKEAPTQKPLIDEPVSLVYPSEVSSYMAWWHNLKEEDIIISNLSCYEGSLILRILYDGKNVVHIQTVDSDERLKVSSFKIQKTGRYLLEISSLQSFSGEAGTSNGHIKLYAEEAIDNLLDNEKIWIFTIMLLIGIAAISIGAIIIYSRKSKRAQGT